MNQAVPSVSHRPRPQVADTAATPAPLIEIRGVSAGYENKRQKTRLIALRDVFLDVYPGEFLAIVGPSGCGKTTLINMIAGFMKPLEGSIRVGGKIVDGPGPDRAMVFQDYAVLPWRTVYTNVRFALENRHPRPSREASGSASPALSRWWVSPASRSRFLTSSPAECVNGSESPAPWCRNPRSC